ncbi:MAG TPA: amino acid ABC transporter substrate-binding protein [Chloroflexi bacterium]|nr:amino acid ABC transporter substrate-binding protein [Chloroflexota bacterium]
MVGLLWLLTAEQSASLLPFLRRDATWQAIQQRGVWRVGLDPSFPPFEMLDANGAPVGYDVDLAHAVAATWGVRAEIVAVGFDSLPDTLKTGKIDSIVSAYPYDERLTQDFRFSAPYFDAGLRIAVPIDSPIRALTDLTGRQVGVEWGSLGDMVGRRLQRNGMAMTLTPFETPDALIGALLDTRQVEAILLDAVSLRQAQGRGLSLRGVDAPLESVPYVIVMPQRAYALQEQVAASLQQLQARGELAKLEERWFGAQAIEEQTE